MCGRPVCKRCRKGPRHTALCEGHSGVRLIAGWAEVVRTASELDAELAASRLRGGGLEAHVLSQKDRANVVTFGGLSVLRVLAPAFHYEEALQLLREEGAVGSD